MPITSRFLFSLTSKIVRFSAGFSFGLRLTEVRIPNHTVRDSSARLECHFDLDGEALYSVKWYKDGNEFYRYVPRDMPPAQVFILPGVSVDVSIMKYFFPAFVCKLFSVFYLGECLFVTSRIVFILLFAFLCVCVLPNWL